MAYNVSWRPPYCPRLYGKLVCWDGEYAVVRRHTRKYRVHKKDLTFEVG